VINDDSPKIELVENTKTSSIVRVGDVLITLKSNPEHTEAVLEIEDLITKEKETIYYKVSESSGIYTTEMYFKEELVNTYVTDYDPLEPGITGKVLSNTYKDTKKPITADSKASYYYWDSVYFASGYGIKYPHPDYQAYGAQPWDSFYISGNQLNHRHMSESESAVTAQLAPVAAGAAIGSKIGGTVGAVTGAALGLILGSGSCAVLLDENDCIWFWDSKSWAIIPNPVPPFLPYNLPMYFRIGPYTLWDALGIGNP
jgi:hypothetical protein